MTSATGPDVTNPNFLAKMRVGAGSALLAPNQAAGGGKTDSIQNLHKQETKASV